MYHVFELVFLQKCIRNIFELIVAVKQKLRRVKSTVAAIKHDRSVQKKILKAKNASHVHVTQSRGSLILLLGSGGGGIEHLLPYGLLEVLLMREGLSLPDLWPAIEIYRFFLAQAKTLVKVY
jgi:hypothetical protein